MKKVLLTAIILLSLCAIATAEVIIIEAGTTGINSQYYSETGGKWDNSVSKSSAPGLTMGIYSRYADVTVNRQSTARFAPQFKEGGLMEVFVTWGQSANADHVKFTIYHRDGKTDRYLKMDGWGAAGPSNKDTWISLGQYYFNKGIGGAVEVSAQEITGRPDQRNFPRIYADAVKFVSVTSGVVSVTPAPTYTPLPSYTPPPSPSATPIATIYKTPVYSTPPQPTPYPVVTPAPVVMPTSSEIKWFSDYKTAKNLASRENKKLLIYFRTSKSKDSQKYEDQIFTNPSVAQEMSNYISVKIDLILSQELAFEQDVYRAPTIIIFDTNGAEITRTSSFLDVNEFINFLRTY